MTFTVPYWLLVTWWSMLTVGNGGFVKKSRCVSKKPESLGSGMSHVIARSYSGSSKRRTQRMAPGRNWSLGEMGSALTSWTFLSGKFSRMTEYSAVTEPNVSPSGFACDIRAMERACVTSFPTLLKRSFTRVFRSAK